MGSDAARTAAVSCALGAGAGVAAVAGGSLAAPAQAAADKADDKSRAPLNIIDFHNHYVGPSFALTTLAAAPPALRSYWKGSIASLRIRRPAVVDRDSRDHRPRDQHADRLPRGRGRQRFVRHRATHQRSNGRAGRQPPGRLYGLATVDTYGGDAGARELTRAVRARLARRVRGKREEGSPAHAPQARPTLAAAAALGVPVFVHPVTDPAMHNRFKRYGRLGVRLARSTINSAALFALLEGGTFDALPLASWSRRSRSEECCWPADWRRPSAAPGCSGADPPSRLHRHDGPAPVLVRSAVNLLGADHVLAGTDWPIARRNPCSNVCKRR